MSYTHRRAPDASTTTSSTSSVNRSINSPTTFLLWNMRLVAGSFWIKLQIAAQAHVRSAYSGDLSCSLEIRHVSAHATHLVQHGQHLPLLRRVDFALSAALTKVRIGHSHRVVPLAPGLLLRLSFAHDRCICRV